MKVTIEPPLCFPLDMPRGVESCDECEFNMSRKSGPGIGTVLSGERGDFRYCEKGFWKEQP